jgi:2-methylisocitrate lyase-like PEP mutase family enzyme
MVIYPITPILAAYESVKTVYERLFKTGKSGFPQEKTSMLSRDVLETISLNKLLQVEEKVIKR